MKRTLALLLLILAAVVLAGCTSSTTAGQETSRDAVRAHYEYHEDWSPGLGCYGKVSGYAYNAGTAAADNVAVHLNLVNARTGTIRDSRSVYIGMMGAGQSVTFEAVLDGECLQEYRVEGFVAP